MRGVGITRVMNYWVWEATDAQVLAYADRAWQLGMKVIYPVNGINDRIALVKNHPATWGYYIGDEARGDGAWAIGAAQAKAKAIDPAHPTMYADWGLSMHLNPDAARIPDVLLGEFYPVGLPDWEIGQTDEAAAETEAYARDRHAMVLQAFDWSMEDPLYVPDNALGGWPTTAQMCRMSKLADQQMTMWFDFYFIPTPSPYLDRLEQAIKCAEAP